MSESENRFAPNLYIPTLDEINAAKSLEGEDTLESHELRALRRWKKTILNYEDDLQAALDTEESLRKHGSPTIVDTSQAQESLSFSRNQARGFEAQLRARSGGSKPK